MCRLTICCFLFVFLQFTAAQETADKPVQIVLSVINSSGENVNDTVKAQIEKSVQYCRTFGATRWNIKTEYPKQSIDTATIDWDKQNCDKFFLVSLDNNAGKIDGIDIQEVDVQIRRCGVKGRYGISSPEKLPDVLFQAVMKHYTPILRVIGGVVAGSSDVNSILMPYARTFDREGSIASVEPIPYTVLVIESADALTNTLKFKVVSGIPNALSARRKGRTEIIAAGISLAEREEMTPTVIRIQLPLSIKPVPVYDIYEVFLDEKESGKKAVKLGRSSTDGAFELSAEPERLLRVIQIRSGNSSFAQFPAVRSRQGEITVPIADAPVRAEAESFLKGLQDEFIDTLAKKIILEKRLTKVDGKERSKVQNDMMNLKRKERFLLELEQGRLHFRSDIPAVQRRIDRMFRETEKSFRSTE